MGLMSEYISKRLSAHDLDIELRALIKRYNDYRKTYLLVMVGAIGKQIPDIALNQEDFYTIADILSKVKGTTKKIDVYLETPGGSGEAAEEIVEFLHNNFEYVSFVISGEAKSAGTIMVMSADDILMTETGSLGPIDAQVRIGRSTVSAYDYMDWVEEKHKEANLKGRLNPFDATMVAQINPGELKGVNHALKFAEDLVGKWLKKYKFKHWTETQTRKIPVTEEIKAQKAKEIAQKMTNHSAWRSHGRSIKIKDLEEIGLKITKIGEDPTLNEVVGRIQVVCRLLSNTTSIYKIFATADEKITKMAVQMQNVPSIPKSVKAADVVNFEQKCPQCGKDYKIYAKLIQNPKIDQDFKGKGCIPFPSGNKIVCSCGFEIDLSGIKNEIETNTGKKILD